MPQTLPQGQNATSIFEANGFVPEDVYKLVTQSNNQYSLKPSTISLVMQKIANNYGGTTDQSVQALEVSTNNRIWKQAVIGNQYDTFISASQPVLSDGDTVATIKLSDPSFNMISVGTLVFDDTTQTAARVSATSPGEMTLTFSTSALGSSVQAFDSNDFKQGNQGIKTIYQGGNRTYKAQDSSMNLPFYREHRVGSYSVDAMIKREDANQATYFYFNNQYYYIAKAEMMAFWNAEIADNIYYLQDSPAIGGDFPRGATFINQIKNNDGIIKSFQGSQSLSQFEDIEEELIGKGAIGQDCVINIVGGVRYGRNLSNMFTPFFETAGTNNIIGASSLHVQKFKTRMNNVIHWYHDPMFNNVNQMGANRSNSALWIPNTLTKSEDDKMLSPIANIYYGQKGLQTTVINGKIGRDGKTVAVGSNDQPHCQVTATMDRSKVLMCPEGFAWCVGN
jgi:hypothetical protein